MESNDVHSSPAVQIGQYRERPQRLSIRGRAGFKDGSESGASTRAPSVSSAQGDDTRALLCQPCELGVSVATRGCASSTSQSEMPNTTLKGGKKDKFARLPCRVCGQLFSDMPKKGAECWDHTRDSAALLKSLEATFKEKPSEETKKNMEDFKEMRKTATQPPSEYSKEVLKYSQACPAMGRGVSRGTYSQFRQTEENNAITQTQKGIHGVKMHKERFLNWCKYDYCIPPEDAVAWWQVMLESYDHTDEDLVDNLGPAFSKLQMTIPKEGYVDGSAIQQHIKRLQLASKMKRIGSAEELDEAQNNLSQGHARFGSKQFEQAGGSFVLQAAKMGATSLANSAGAGTFSGKRGQEVVNSLEGFGADVEVSAEPKAKKAKKYEVDKKVAALQETIQKMETAAVEHVDEANKKALETINLAGTLEEAMPGIAKWKNILVDRYEWLQNVMHAKNPVENITDVGNKYMDDHIFKLLHDAATVVNVELLKEESSRDFGKIDALAGLEGFKNWWLELVFVRHGWFGAGFKAVPVLADMSRDVNTLMNVRMAMLNHFSFTDTMEERKQRSPVEDVHKLLPVAAFTYLHFAAGCCAVEHDVKSVGFPSPFRIRTRWVSLSGVVCVFPL